MSFWFEAWTRPGSATFGRLIEDLTYADASYHEGINQVGDGNASLPFDAPTSTLLDPSIPAGSLLRLIHDSDPDYPAGEWLTTQITPETDANDPTVEAAGVGMNSTLAYARLEPFDWDGADDFISRDPDWIYGGYDFAVNGGLEDHPFGIPNVGFEDGTRIPWWPGNVEGTNAQAFVQTAVVDTGTYALEVIPLTIEGGASAPMNLWPANFYTVTARVRGVSGVGYQIGAQSSAEAMVPVSGNSVLVELPVGGRYEVQHSFTGTGAWQTVTLVFGTSGDQRSAQLNIREGAVFNGGSFFVDVVEVSGFGVGANPWEPTGTQRPNVLGPVPQFEVSNTQAFTGTWSLFVEAGPGHGAFQRFRGILPGVTYTATVAVGHASAASLWALEIRDVQGNLIAQDSATIATNAWTELQVTFRAPDFIPGADSELQARVINYASAARTVFIDDLVMYRGNPPATIGQILSDIYDDATTNHAGRVVWEDFANPGNPWLILDFDGTNDSNGTPWPGPVEVRLPMRSSYSQIMADLSRQFGVEYRVILDPAQDGQWLWQVFLAGTMGTDLSADPNVAVLSGTTETMRGTAVRLPSATDVMVEGPDKITARDRDAGLIAGLGRIEASIWSRNAETPAEEADEYIDTVQTRLESYRVTVVDPDVVPFVDYKVGDIVWVEDPPISQAFRVMDIIAVLGAETNQFNVQFGSVFNTGEAAMAQAVAGLMPADPVHRPQGLFMPSPDRMLTAGSDRLQQLVGGGGGAPTIVVAAWNASDLSKSKADFECTGNNDEQVIQAALDLLPAGLGGRVLLTEGYFNIETLNVVEVPDLAVLQGLGPESTHVRYFNSSAITDVAIQLGNFGIGAQLRDLAVFGLVGTAVKVSEEQARIYNVHFTGPRAIWVDDADYLEVGNCWNRATTFVEVDAGADVRMIRIHDNICTQGGYLKLSNTVGVMIVNNDLAASIHGNDARGWLISGNKWEGNNVFTGGMINLSQDNTGTSMDPGLIIADNICTELFTDFALIDGVESVSFVNNQWSGGGAVVENTVGPLVRGNRVYITEGVTAGATLALVGCTGGVVGHNSLTQVFEHGILLDTCTNVTVADNFISHEAGPDDTWDGIRLVDSDRSQVTTNTVVASFGQPRSGVNIASGDDNAVVSNYLTTAIFATAPIIDSGTGTILLYPADATYGDNFV